MDIKRTFDRRGARAEARSSPPCSFNFAAEPQKPQKSPTRLREDGLFYGRGDRLRPEDIMFQDNINSDLARSLPRSLPNAAVATCRVENWSSSGEKSWTTLPLSREDFPQEALREILIDCLDLEAVQHTKEGVEEALNRCQRLPGYLVELARSCRASALNLTKETAQAAPAEVIRIIQNGVRSLEKIKALKLLIALARSEESRLHRIHLQALIADDPPTSDVSLPEEFLALSVTGQGQSSLLVMTFGATFS